MTSGEDLFKLRARLGEVLGTEEAGIMMDLFPPTSWDDLATRSGLELVRAELGADMAELRTELKTDMANLRTELKTDMAELRTELRTDMANLRTELRAEMAALAAELRAEMAELRAGQLKLEAGFDRLATAQSHLEAGQVRLETSVNALQVELRSDVTRLERTIRAGLAANSATMVAIAAVVVAAIRL